MSSDNSRIVDKLRLRARWTPDDAAVLDLYSGGGDIWRTVSGLVPLERWYRVDQKKIPGVVTMDNRRAVNVLDLDGFDVVDLDAYGDPLPLLDVLTDRGFGRLVFVTVGGSGAASRLSNLLPETLRVPVADGTPIGLRRLPRLWPEAATRLGWVWQSWSMPRNYHKSWAMYGLLARTRPTIQRELPDDWPALINKGEPT